MDHKKHVLDKLENFRHLEKVSVSVFHQRGLTPSNAESCHKINTLLNNCTDKLIKEIESGTITDRLKTVLKEEILKFKRSDYDTEEAELIGDYFMQLSEIVMVDFSPNINKWQYGIIVSTILNIRKHLKKEEKFNETLSQNCSKCDSDLETFIQQKKKGIPEHPWMIVECNNCREYNIISPGSDINKLRFGNYKLIELLSKIDYTQEQAGLRLEQKKHFRN